MRFRSKAAPWLLLALACAPAAAQSGDEGPTVAPGEKMPPVVRADAQWSAGRAYLEALPPGFKVTIERASGVRFELKHEDGRLSTELPPARVSGDGSVLVSPLGFRLGPADRGSSSLRISSPNGRFTEFVRTDQALAVYEGDGNIWDERVNSVALRLPDGTRVDMLENVFLYEALTLRGERYQYDARDAAWTSLPPIPSPPLIPDLRAYYVGGDGDDWRLPFPEDHTVFAWSWYPYGFTTDSALEEGRRGFRWADLRAQFESLEIMPEAQEPAAYILARRLALGGGDRLTFSSPGGPEHAVILLPGPAEADFFMPKLRNPDTILLPGTTGSGVANDAPEPGR